MPPNPASPVIGAATTQGLTTTDQRGLNRDSAADIGAVEMQATTVTTDDKTLPFSASARNLALSATIGPACGATVPGTLQFNAGALGTASGPISGGSASATLSVAEHHPARHRGAIRAARSNGWITRETGHPRR